MTPPTPSLQQVTLRMDAATSDDDIRRDLIDYVADRLPDAQVEGAPRIVVEDDEKVATITFTSRSFDLATLIVTAVIRQRAAYLLDGMDPFPADILLDFLDAVLDFTTTPQGD